MKTPIFFVSDNHFQNLKSEFEYKRRKNFYSLLNHIADLKGTLIIGGDFFDFWFDYKGYVPSEYVDIFESLKILNRKGVEIHYVLGNHDFWDFDFFKNNFSTQTIKDELQFTLDGEKILVIHGDGVLKEDYSYRIFRTIIRSQLCIFLFNLLPPSIGYFIARKISKADKPNDYYKYKDNKKIKEKLLNYAKEKWNDFDTILIGHYHQDGIFQKENKRLIFLGDWLNKFSVTKYDKGVWTQVKWDK